MRFWDSSAVVPLCTVEVWTERVDALILQDSQVALSWLTVVECWSALARLRREGTISADDEVQGRASAAEICELAEVEIRLNDELREVAGRLIRVHDLRAADALQLATALAWVGGRASGEEFVSFDRRLREAARLEGFKVLPADVDL